MSDSHEDDTEPVNRRLVKWAEANEENNKNTGNTLIEGPIDGEMMFEGLVNIQSTDEGNNARNVFLEGHDMNYEPRDGNFVKGQEKIDYGNGIDDVIVDVSIQGLMEIEIANTSSSTFENNDIRENTFVDQLEKVEGPVDNAAEDAVLAKNDQGQNVSKEVCENQSENYWNEVSSELVIGMKFRSKSDVKKFVKIYEDRKMSKMVVRSGGLSDGCKSKKVLELFLLSMVETLILDSLWLFLWLREAISCYRLETWGSQQEKELYGQSQILLHSGSS